MDDDDSSDVPIIKTTSDLFFTPVNIEAALQQVHDLAVQTAKESDSSVGDTLNEYEALKETIIELARQRDELRDALEIETIKAGKRRQALQILPAIYNKQIEDAVLAARNSNAVTTANLQKQMKKIKEDLTDLNSTIEQLTEENVKLQPECDQIRKEHDDIIAQLNKRMADKSNKQIVLNETRDTLRDVRDQTADIDVGLANLADDMVTERSEAAATKEELQQETTETEKGMEEEKVKIEGEKKINSVLSDRIAEKNSDINEQRKIVGRLENSCMRLEMDAMQLIDKIDRERRANQEMKEENEKSMGIIRKAQNTFGTQIEEMEAKIRKTQESIAEATQENESLLNDKDVFFLAAEEMIIKKGHMNNKAKEAIKRIETLKTELNRLSDESASMSMENKTVTKRLDGQEENHKATIAMYETQIEELRGHVNKERTDRIKVQVQREESEKVLDSFKQDETKYMTKMNKSINDAVTEHQSLTEKNLFLTRDLDEKKRAIETLEVKLEVAQSGLKTMKHRLQHDLRGINTNIDNLVDDIERRKAYYEGKLPVLDETKKKLETTDEEYAKLKKDLLSIRNVEKSLLEQKHRTKLLLEKLQKPLKELKGRLKVTNEKGLEQLQSQADELKELEMSIYNTTATLENIAWENMKLQENSVEIKEDIEILTSDMTSHAAHQHNLHDELKDVQSQFMDSWDVCMHMENLSSLHDAETLEGIRRLQEETRERAQILSGIADKMKADLDSLTRFTANVESRRPKDTREEQKRRRLRRLSAEGPRKSTDVLSTRHSLRRQRSSAGLLQPPESFNQLHLSQRLSLSPDNVSASITDINTDSSPNIVVKVPTAESLQTLRVHGT